MISLGKYDCRVEESDDGRSTLSTYEVPMFFFPGESRKYILALPGGQLDELSRGEAR